VLCERGETNLLRLSLDRSDLWDECPAKPHVAVKDRFHWSAMQRMVAENRMDEFNEVFDSNCDYDGPPTKLPAGRVEIILAPAQQRQSFELNLATAEGIAYAVCAGWKRVGNETLLAVTVATRREGKSPQAVAQARVEKALSVGWARTLRAHADWWRVF